MEELKVQEINYHDNKVFWIYHGVYPHKNKVTQKF